MLKSLQSKLFKALVCILLCSPLSAYSGVVYNENFNGEEREVGVFLSWSTDSEENSSMFFIERATDGEDFESIGAVGGAGNSDKLTDYNYLDLDVRGTYVLYRLQQVDKDGTTTYSKPLFINKTNENNFMVSRMTDVMTMDDFEVTFDMLIDADVEYHLKNAKGETVIKEHMSFDKGVNDLIIDMADADLGTYKLTLKVLDEEEEITFKKIKNNKQTVTAKKN